MAKATSLLISILILIPAWILGCGGTEPASLQQELSEYWNPKTLAVGEEEGEASLELRPTNRLTADGRPLVVCLPDRDGDGFGAAKAKPRVLPGEHCPAGQASVGGDCADRDPRAFPGQQDYFDTPVDGGGNSWDFNCDGTEERRHVSPPVSCDAQPTEVLCHQWSDGAGPHWVEVIPGCGEQGQLASGIGCTWDGSSCSTTVAGERVQPCR